MTEAKALLDKEKTEMVGKLQGLINEQSVEKVSSNKQINDLQQELQRLKIEQNQQQDKELIEMLNLCVGMSAAKKTNSN